MRRAAWVSDNGWTVTFEGHSPEDGPGQFFLKELTSDLGATAEAARSPRQDGVTTYYTALDARTINLAGSMLVYGGRHTPALAEYDKKRTYLHQAFAPNRWGVLTYYREDGAVQVRCRPLATPTVGAPTGTFSTVDISFTTDSPYWESAEEVVEALGVIQKLRHFPWAPLRGPMGTFSPFATGSNPTGVDVYPTIEVYSTSQYVTVSNLDTGEAVTIEHTIAEGQKLTIDMRDVTAILWALDEAGIYREKEDVSHWMSLDSVPWCLKPGGSRITIRNEAPEDTPVAYVRYRVPSLGI